MSPRAACRLELLGFTQVYDYVLGKADWLAYGLPTEGEQAQVLRAKDLLRRDALTAHLSSRSEWSRRGWRARRTGLASNALLLTYKRQLAARPACPSNGS